MARIICYGTKVKYFPIRLSQPFVKTSILDEEFLTDAELLSSLLKVISRNEEEILEQNLEQVDEGNVDLLDALSTYQCYASPTVKNIEHKEIV